MPATAAFVQRAVACLIALALGYVVLALANPQDYPQFAQQQEDPSIPITFIGVKVVKQQFDAGRPPMLVDVRSAEDYAYAHLPKAVSIPLEVLAVHMAEIPQDMPVVLY